MKFTIRLIRHPFICLLFYSTFGVICNHSVILREVEESLLFSCTSFPVYSKGIDPSTSLRMTE